MAGDWTRRRSQTALSVLGPGQGRPPAVEAQAAFPGHGDTRGGEAIPLVGRSPSEGEGVETLLSV